MGGQVWGGGVIVAVAVALWLVYLVPTWHSRARYNAAERNAVRLNQALRVLAETSETPEEVRVELSARAAAAQHRIVRERQRAAERTRAEEERLALELDKQREAARVEALRAQLEQAKHSPELVQARARRRVRLVATFAALSGIVALIAAGIVAVVPAATLAPAWLAVPGVALAALGALTLQRMARVAARQARAADAAGSARDAARAEAAARRRAAQPVQDVALERASWSPRRLPEPLSNAAGSHAARELDAREARQALARAAREEAMLARQAHARRAAVAVVPAAGTAAAAAPAASARFARMGYVDDAEIEAHVRELLSRRAVGS